MCKRYAKKIMNKVKTVSIIFLSILFITQCVSMRLDSTFSVTLLSNAQNLPHSRQMDMLIDQAEPVENENLTSLPDNQTRMIQTSFRNQFHTDPFGLFFVSSGQYKALRYATFLGSTFYTMMISMKYINVRLQKDGKKKYSKYV